MRSAISSQAADSSKTIAKRDTDFSVKGIIGKKEASNKFTKPSSKNNATTYNFTMDDILLYFFGEAKYSQVEKDAASTKCLSHDQNIGKDDKDYASKTCCGVCQQKTSDQCSMHGPLQSLRKLVHTEQHSPEMNDKVRVTYAVASFPPEVQLCESLIPGHFYGVCARQFIPVGTWIGPYEGVRVPAEDIQEGMDMSYMWEVYENGRISSYLDGRDENLSSWMRFIRCARHKHEQNLFIFQYADNIYYRAYKDITPGCELLVWYDDQYEKFLGVPIRLRYMNPALIGQVYPNDADPTTSTKDSNCPPSSSVPPTQPLHCDTQLHSTAAKNENVRSRAARNECNVPTTTSEITKVTADTKGEGCELTSPHNGESAGSLEAGIWRCGQCFKSFTQRSLLQVHVCPRLPEKPYQCGHCAQSFAHPTDLRTHVVTHNSERPFKCGFCGRSFAGSTTLNNHIRTHTGQKPFVCEKCSRSFSQASQLSRHQRLPGDCSHRNTVY